MDDFGQLSLEYVMVIMISILLILIVSFPLANLSIDISNDVVDVFSYKNELSKISDGIDYCHASGRGSKRAIFLDFNHDCDINLISKDNGSLINCVIHLKNGSKDVNIYSKAPVVSKKIFFSKGFNKVSIEWDLDTNSINVIKI